ncbi:MAG: chemotaxis protein CheA, partial [Syntrophomonadaceae bacterium]
IERISTDLQSVVMKVRMVPIEQVFNRFPRMVRDLAKELNKEIELIMEGKETELDRTVIDEIGDPLIHLLRNAIDHGLESPSVRTQKGKPRIGTIILRARHEGNSVFIEVEDDGAGIQIERVKNKAVAKGIITAKEAEEMTAEQAVDLLFSPGFSTAENITDVSGRGVGLDVVKSKIESLNGEIQVDSKPGQGTKFVVKLPLTLAIIQALMVAVRDEIYAIPLSTVNETTMLSSEDIRLIQNQEVIVLRGNVLPLYRLDSLLEVPGETQSDESYVVVVHKGNKQIGLVVDRLIGQQEIVIKSLGKVLAGTPGIAGAIVAGDGNVRLILDIDTLF